MKKLIFTLTLFISMCSFAQDAAMSKFRAKPIVVDGIANDWNLPLRFYNNETSLFFAILNDSNTLYLCFQTKDEKTQMRINKAGMQVELKAKGKLKCDATIDFPLTQKRE